MKSKKAQTVQYAVQFLFAVFHALANSILPLVYATNLQSRWFIIFNHILCDASAKYIHFTTDERAAMNMNNTHNLKKKVQFLDRIQSHCFLRTKIRMDLYIYSFKALTIYLFSFFNLANSIFLTNQIDEFFSFPFIAFEKPKSEKETKWNRISNRQ